MPDLSEPTKRSLLSVFSSKWFGRTVSFPSADAFEGSKGVGKDKRAQTSLIPVYRKEKR